MEENIEPKEELSAFEKINRMYEAFETTNKGKSQKKPKEFKVPAKARVSKSKAAKGWVGILKVEQNGNGNWEKQQLDNSVFKTKDGIFHASDGREVITIKGRPLIIQPSWRQNPVNVFSGLDNVYGQKPILAKMQTSVYTGEIKKKGGMKGILWIILIAVVGYFGYNLITKGHL